MRAYRMDAGRCGGSQSEEEVMSQDVIVWYLRALNWVRRFFRIREVRYLTDREWREYMRSIIPKPKP